MQGVYPIVKYRLGVWSIEAIWEKFLLGLQNALNIEPSLHKLHL